MKKLFLLALFSASCSGVLPYPVESYKQGSSLPGADASAPPAVDAAPVVMVDAAPAPVMMVDAAPAPMVDAGAPPSSSDAASADAPRASADASSGGGSEGGGPPVLASCTSSQDAVALLANRCGSCHGARGAAKNLDLVSAGLDQRLYDVKASCAGHVLVEGTADMPKGLLLDKLVGKVADCGERMPYGTPFFTDAEMSCVTAWVGQVITTQGR